MICMAVIAMLTSTVSAQSEVVTPYYELNQLPKLIKIMPEPPAFDSPEFANDVVRYGWGKQQRQDSARVALAIADAEWDDHAKLFLQWRDAFGLEISPIATPEIWKLMETSLATTDPMRKETKGLLQTSASLRALQRLDAFTRRGRTARRRQLSFGSQPARMGHLSPAGSDCPGACC